MATLQQELIVRGEQVERVFINYQDKKYLSLIHILRCVDGGNLVFSLFFVKVF